MRRSVALAVLIATTLGGSAVFQQGGAPRTSVYAALGAPKLRAAYDAWVRAHEAAGGDRSVHFALRPAVGHAAPHAAAAASGEASIDLASGDVRVDVRGLSRGSFDVWLVDRRAGASGAEDGDARVLAGRLAPGAAGAELCARLDPRLFASFQVDLVSVAPAGAGPAGALVQGRAPLFQRLYTALRSPALLARSDLAATDAESAPSAWSFGARAAWAAEPRADSAKLLERLIARGERLFTEEKFAGNGRTCASCHPLGRNTTLGVSDIANLSDGDPLFVAEFNPALAFSLNGPKLEVPVLMRGAALILENVDGRQDLAHKFVMRGIPHTLALRTSIDPDPRDGFPVPPVHRTGWSGDGAPGDGSLREFASGAVAQHFTRSFARVPGRDFRLPTDDELDALEAFQLSLGRQEDPVLPLPLRNPIVARGQELFMARGPVGAGNCTQCHDNAGANAPPGGGVARGGNFMFSTGVEAQGDRPAELILRALQLDLAPEAADRMLPPDGGFADEGDPDQFGDGDGSLAHGFGNSFFNTPSVIESADTPPFFHDNSIRTLEGAVAFYNTDAFNQSFAGLRDRTKLEATQVEAIAAFLRALNALENIRQTRELLLALRSLDERDRYRQASELLERAAGEIGDAVLVLVAADLQPDTVRALGRASQKIRVCQALRVPRTERIDDAIAALDQARATLVTR